MSGQDYEQLTLFQEGSPASRSVQPGSAEAVRMTVTSGQRCLELSRKSGPLGLLEKMLLGSSIWHSTRCFLTWRDKATKQGRLYFRLAASTPRTGESGSQYWDASTAADTPLFPTITRFDATCGDIKGKEFTGKTRHGMKLIQAAKLYPTPTAQMRKGPSHSKTRQGGPNLQTAISDIDGPGQLNSEWVEAMMGFPPGWTELEEDGQMEPGSLASKE